MNASTRNGAKAKADLRVIKTLAAGERGAKSLTAEHGDRLVCVRHRIDATGTRRIVTVELVVAERAIAQRPSPPVCIRALRHERQLQAQLRGAGAVWDPKRQLWCLRRATAMALGLKNRLVP